MTIEEQIKQLRSVRGSFVISADSPAIFQWADDAADTLTKLNAVLVAAELLSDHVHIAPNTTRFIRPDHHEALKAAIAEVRDD